MMEEEAAWCCTFWECNDYTHVAIYGMECGKMEQQCIP